MISRQKRCPSRTKKQQADKTRPLRLGDESVGSVSFPLDSRVLTAYSSSPVPLTLTGHPKETTGQGPEPKRVTPFSSAHPPGPQSLGLRSGSYSLPRNIHIGRNQNLRKSTTPTNSHNPGGSKGPVSAPETERVSQSREPSQALAAPPDAALELDGALIPPPEAFQDIQPEQRGQGSLLMIQRVHCTSVSTCVLVGGELSEGRGGRPKRVT